MLAYEENAPPLLTPGLPSPPSLPRTKKVCTNEKGNATWIYLIGIVKNKQTKNYGVAKFLDIVSNMFEPKRKYLM